MIFKCLADSFAFGRFVAELCILLIFGILGIPDLYLAIPRVLPFGF